MLRMPLAWLNNVTVDSQAALASSGVSESAWSIAWRVRSLSAG